MRQDTCIEIDGWTARDEPPAAFLAICAVLAYRYTGWLRVEIEYRRTGKIGESAETSERAEVAFDDDPTIAEVVRRLEGCSGTQPPWPAFLRCRLPAPIVTMLAHGQHAEEDAVYVSRSGDTPGATTLSVSLDTFDHDAVSRLIRHFSTLERSARQTPESRVSELAMLGDEELHQMLVELNGPMVDVSCRTIDAVLAERMREAPAAIALDAGERKLSYRRLHEAAAGVAAALQSQGIGPEVPVGVCLDDPLDTAIAYVGIVMAGGVLVTLDPEWPEGRLESVVREVKPPIVVTGPGTTARIPPGCRAMLLSELAAEEGGRLRKFDMTPDHAAFIAFTSGSTGAPKGIVGLHRTITSALALVAPSQERECFALSADLAFGAAVIGFFFGLLQGGTILLVSRSATRDIRALVTAWEAAHVTRIVMVPAQLRQLCAMGTEASTRLQKVKAVALSGAVLTPELLPIVYELFPGATVTNSYSCLEIGRMVTRWQATPKDRARPLNIGRVLPNVGVYILGPHMNLLPLGMPGEIHVASADACRGYVNRPDETNERFVPNPFPSPGIDRLYRTGDLARLLPNGEIEFVGRKDNQLKIRGIRVEGEEVEAALHQHRDVCQAAVVGILQGNEMRLAAFVSAKPGRSLSTRSLRTHLAERLPSYMAPSLFVIMDRLPLTGNGKIDRQRLPKVGATRPETDSPYAEPRNSLESAIKRIWEEELGVDGIGVLDHFLEIGGDSLNAARIAVRLQSELKQGVSVIAPIEHGTIRELAAHLGDPSEEKQTNPVATQSWNSAPGIGG